MYKVESLINQPDRKHKLINGRWVAARPACGYPYESFLSRLRDAWAVLTGKADAFEWPEGQ